MPILIPENLPTRWMLESEGIFLIDRPAAIHQDVHPLRIAVLDLADAAIPAEYALARQIASSPLQTELTVLRPTAGILPGERYRIPLAALKQQAFDALIVSDDPNDPREWSDAPYWDELRDALDWAAERIPAHLYLGWSAQAALQHFHAIDSRLTVGAPSGLVVHRAVRANSFLLRGFNDRFQVPVRRSRVVERDAIQDAFGLEILAESLSGEPYLVRSQDRSKVFALHHPELDVRDDDTAQLSTWRSHGALLIANWLNYYVYQLLSHPVVSGDDRPTL
jgi:homoserine O-succinyltransferase